MRLGILGIITVLLTVVCSATTATRYATRDWDLLKPKFFDPERSGIGYSTFTASAIGAGLGVQWLRNLTPGGGRVI